MQKLITYKNFKSMTMNKFNQFRITTHNNIRLAILTKIKVAKFSTSSRLTTESEDEGCYDTSIPRGERFLRVMKHKLRLQEDEKQVLKEDLTLIKPAIEAQSHISTGRIPPIEQDKKLWEIKDNYPAFFDDSEGEEEGISNLTRLKQVKSYILKELKSNRKQTTSLLEYRDKVISGQESVPIPRSANDLPEPSSRPIIERGESSSRPIIERGESSSRPIVVEEYSGQSSSRSIIERGESSSRPIVVEEDLITESSSKSRGKRRKIDHISDNEDSTTESSKKSRQSPGDYIDSLPELPYNPLDDWD